MEVQAPLALPKELTKKYEDAMWRNLEALRRANKMSQNQLKEELERRGLQVRQGNLSQYLSGNKPIPLALIVHLCDIFKVSLAELVSEDFSVEKRTVTQMPQIYSDDLLNLVPSLGDSFITNPNSPEFHGYLQTYHFYMLPTQSPRIGMMTGTIKLQACGNVCEAHMELNTGRVIDGKPLYRHYQGRVIIAKAIDAVYILLTSPAEGDLSVISFGHYHLSTPHLNCRIAAVLTNETGEYHSPTMHRMFLSRTPIQPEHLPLLLPHLQLNNSSITISADKLELLRKNHPEYGRLLDSLAMIIPASDTYYWNEEYVVGVAKPFLSKEQLPLFLNRIRESSSHHAFNKASRRANYLVQNLLLSLGYFHDHYDDN